MISFVEALKDDDLVSRLYESIMNEKEEIWFDIYRSITSQDEAKEKATEKKRERIRLRQEKKRLLLK